MLSRRVVPRRIGGRRPCAPFRRRGMRRSGDDRRRLLPRAMVSRKLPGARRRSRRRSREQEALRHHVGAARLPLLQGNASGQFRQARDRRTTSRQRFEILQLNIIGSREVTDFDGEKLTEKRFAREIRRARRAGLPVLSRQRRGPCARRPREREVARGQGYIEPRAFPRHVPFRRRARLREGQPARLPQGRHIAADLTRLARAQPTLR